MSGVDRMVDEEREAIARLAGHVERLDAAREAVKRVVVGQEAVIDQLLVAMMCSGHVLVESAPGLGKTLLVRTVAAVFGLKFARIQFTPDLMPADITGTVALVADDTGATVPRFQEGPVFAQLVLADEVNRATPKTQSALLEAMQERTVTTGGTARELPRPFLVMATQNPIEMEGTYVLPEAQVDRFFFKLTIPYPTEGRLDEILAATTGAEEAEPNRVSRPADLMSIQAATRAVPISSDVRRTIARFVLATHPEQEDASGKVKRFVRYGVSPRGGQVLVLAAKARSLLEGRYNVDLEDVRHVLLPALRHRLHLSFEGETEGVRPESLLEGLFEQVARR